MKKIFFMSLVILLAACNSKKTADNESTPTTVESPTQMKDINSPYPVNYSAKFVMDDPKNAESLLSIWKAWDDGDLFKVKELFADTVELHFSDGSMLRGARDSVLGMGQKERSGIESVSSSVDAVMAIKSTDKKEQWATIWGMERSTVKGKTDSSYVQETCRFDSAGRLNLMFQFSAAGTAPKQ